MIQISSIEDISLLRESVDLEIKLARGADGKGVIPKDFWPTYSAFANTHGGVILLGLREHKGEFTLDGIDAPEKLLRADLFNTIESGKVSCNLLTDRDVRIVEIDGKSLIEVRVPAATRKQKPVHLHEISVIINQQYRLFRAHGLPLSHSRRRGSARGTLSPSRPRCPP